MDSNTREKARIAGFIEVTPTTPYATRAWIKADKIKYISLMFHDGAHITMITMMGDLDSDAWAVKESVGDILLMLADVGKAP